MSSKDPTATATEIIKALDGYTLIEAVGILAVIQQEMYLITSGLQPAMTTFTNHTETH